MREDEVVRVKEKWIDRDRYIAPLLTGLQCTLKNFFSKKLTVEYPDERMQVSENWRGLHQLVTDEDDKLLCVGCGLCAALCPAGAISLVPYEDEEGNRYPEEFVIDELRCIFCGFCQEICPRGALKMSRVYDYVDYEREDFLFDLEKLEDPQRFQYSGSRSMLRKLLG
ncbi:MAG: NuoI/complex I 23 kDa subunit family protein [Thermodesulfobacteriota bacterium]